jgi:hypothetical protein
MKKIIAKRLQLTRDTIRTLDLRDLGGAAGGLRSRSSGQDNTCSYRCSLNTGCDGGCV